MLGLLWMVPALPLAGAVTLFLFGRRISQPMQGCVGGGSVGLAALVTLLVGSEFLGLPEGSHYQLKLWDWINVAGLNAGMSLYLDGLSLVMCGVVTGVGFLIHLYSIEYMRRDHQVDGGFARFFAYMNLFVAAMLLLVLGDNLLLLYLGWEGVGICSYLLIGFWYADADNGKAARKAFIVTRVGDVALAIALFLLFASFGTLDIQPILERAPQEWKIGGGLATAAALLLLGGAVGKSAQLPLQVWLPDAMAGPTPVSALIHAATMVTAGVYLIARTHVLFLMAPDVLQLVAWVGAGTLLMAGFTALAQNDIKRILAWSTVSQIGYMFLALGVGAWSAAVFHLMTHAFFKALLFMAAGAVIINLHHEQNIYRMGGLRKRMPIAFAAFLVGSAALAAIPWITAGFYSKDRILWEVWASARGGPLLWGIALLGAFLTSLYISRLMFIVFFGRDHTDAKESLRWQATLPLAILALLSLVGGAIALPVLDPVLPPWLSESFLNTPGYYLMVEVTAITATALGILFGWLFFGRRSSVAASFLNMTIGRAMRQYFASGWAFDRLYDLALVQPYLRLARIIRHDLINDAYVGIEKLSIALHHTISRTQTGSLRWYAAALGMGMILLLAIMVMP
ncbi:MAG: NADH-quinone oxidoreductase subunit L [Salinisphaeraceae bacterium]|nr:NADH-quinone oxidoreductase subunit L [Salinisphaeraceae bacterium]